MNADITATGGFNTGRLYTSNGQRIFWVQLDDGWLYFHDIDRMVDGWLKRDEKMKAMPPLPSWIVRKYDRYEVERQHPDASFTHLDPALQPPADFDYGEPLNI